MRAIVCYISREALLRDVKGFSDAWGSDYGTRIFGIFTLVSAKMNPTMMNSMPKTR